MSSQKIHDKSFREEFERNFEPSNQVLSKEDQEIIRSLISEIQTIVDSLDHEIRVGGNLLPALEDRYAREVARIKILRNGVATYKVMPSEILSSIFIHTLDHSPTAVKWKSGDSPWNLIQVCSRWRTVGVSHNELWNTIVFFAEEEEVFSALNAPIAIQSHYPILETLVVKVNAESDVERILAQFSQYRNIRNFEIKCGAKARSKPSLYCSEICALMHSHCPTLLALNLTSSQELNLRRCLESFITLFTSSPPSSHFRTSAHGLIWKISAT